MKKLLKVIGYVVVALLVVAGALAAYVAATGIPHYAPGNVQIKVAVTPERVARGKKFAGMRRRLPHEPHHAAPPTPLEDLPAEFSVAYSEHHAGRRRASARGPMAG